jgi:hypothetical protein
VIAQPRLEGLGYASPTLRGKEKIVNRGVSARLAFEHRERDRMDMPTYNGGVIQQDERWRDLPVNHATRLTKKRQVMAAPLCECRHERR